MILVVVTLCTALPSTQPVEVPDRVGGQTDQRQYIDKTELLSVPLTAIIKSKNDANATLTSSFVKVHEIRKNKEKLISNVNFVREDPRNSSSTLIHSSKPKVVL